MMFKGVWVRLEVKGLGQESQLSNRKKRQNATGSRKYLLVVSKLSYALLILMESYLRWSFRKMVEATWARLVNKMTQ